MIKDKFFVLFNKIKNSKYDIILISFLFLIFFFGNKKSSDIVKECNYDSNSIKVLYIDSCYHCRQLKEFLANDMEKKYNIEYLNLSEQRNLNFLLKMTKKYRIPLNAVGTPIMFSKDSYIMGFDSTEKGKSELINFLEKNKNSVLLNKKDFNSLDVLNYVYKSLFNVYSLCIILILTSFLIMINSDKKSNLILSCIMFSIPIISFLLLIDWLNVYMLVIFTRFVNFVFGLFILYYVIKNFYYLFKENKNIFDNNKELNKNFPIFIVFMSSIFNTINITRNTNIYDINSINSFLIYSILVGILFTFIIYILKKSSLLVFNKILNNNSSKIYLMFNSILFLSSLFIIFLLNY